ncbi:tripartite-type tricarboxylate transporter receptor subunit TctC [Paracandidimonas soli]|uniref:Tripartite-type tricarboxylate transporter receptor subunit TctC n=2 Tax=Paracandidimonas soli TaxID=1917182 RepID=A0A4R3VGA5_9BURK|nr:tripartite-type tricarboxylate transporter receptor subunit TctC [Paracandidimonas soli]
MIKTNRRQFLATGVGLAAAPMFTYAQTWPSKPIRIVAAYAPGGSIDAMARWIGKYFETAFNATAVVENLSGAGGRIGTQNVARSAGDGYTLMVTSSAAHGGAPAVYPRETLGYDPIGQFTHIALISSAPIALIVRADSPYKTLADLVKDRKQSGKAVLYGSGGIGGLGHLSGEMMGQHLGLRMEHVPYRGSVPAMQDLLGNSNLDAISDNLSSHMGQVRAGTVRILAMASEKRFSELPDVPTFAEQGYPGVIATSWYGFSGSAGIPPEIVARLNQAVNTWTQQEDVRKFILETAMTPEGRMSSEEYTKFVESEIAKWTAVVKESGIEVE